MRAALIALALSVSACSAITPSSSDSLANQRDTTAVATPSDAPATASVTPSQVPTATKTANATTQPKATSTADEAKAQQAAIEAGEFVIVPERKRVTLAKWSGTDLNGNAITTASLTGQITLVNFWASWCGPCREEWPILTAASAMYPNVKLIGINTQDSLDRAKAWISANPTSYPHLFDERAEIKASLTTVPNMGMPITVVLDAKGRIFAWFSGAINAKALEEVLS